MLSRVSAWRLTCTLRLASQCQASTKGGVLSTAKFRIQACHWNKTLICARRIHDASRSRINKRPAAGDSDLEISGGTAQNTLIFQHVATVEPGQDGIVYNEPDELTLQKAADSTLQTPKRTQSFREPFQIKTRVEPQLQCPPSRTQESSAGQQSVFNSPQSTLLPFVQREVESGNLFNPLLANFIRRIKSQEERISAVGQILPILQSLIARTGEELDFARRRRPARVGPLQKKYDGARTSLHKVETLAQELQAPIAKHDEVTTLFERSREIKDSSNWNVPGLQRSTRNMGVREKEEAINVVLRALEGELSLYKKIGTKSNLKTAIENLSSIKSWALSQQKRGSLGGVILECAERPNRFTMLSYPNKTEEIEDLKKWQATQRQELSDSATTSPAEHDKAAEAESVAHQKLGRHHDMKTLQIYMVSLYLEEIQLSDLNLAQTEQLLHDFEGRDQHRREPGLALAYDVSLLDDLPNVPYRVAHYIFDQVLHEVQLAMFKYGCRKFAGQMRRKHWHSVESVPVVDFLKVMKIFDADKTRLDFCEEEIMALRVLRNAHAHHICDIDVRQLRASVSAMCVLCRAIDPLLDENAILHDYRKLLIQYERRVIAELLRTRPAARKRYSHLTAQHEAVQNRLDHSRMTAQGTGHDQGQWKHHINMRKTADHNRYCKRMEATATKQQREERDIMLSLAFSLQNFTYEVQVRRALRLLPSVKQKLSLLQKLHEELSPGSGVFKTTDPPAQSDKEQPAH